MTVGLTEPQSRNLAEDRRFMAAALEFARRGLGQVAPNPAVGALVVKDGVVIGRGHTRVGGRPHAETEALREAGNAAAGATLYVTLEPCSHYGETPPCAEAIIAAGIARVVSAIEDPDPRVGGRGHGTLRAAGIDVSTGVLAEAARRANLGHILRVVAGRPMVTLKLAETADGFAAALPPAPRLAITGPIANGQVHVWRAQHDAIMIGIGTVFADDPLLTVRLPGAAFRPLRIVLDGKLALAPTSRLARTARDFPTLIVTGDKASADTETQLTDRGIEIVRVASDGGRSINLASALSALAARGVTRLFSEGGPRIAAALIAEDFADDVVLLTNARPLGQGVPALDAASRAKLSDPAVYRRVAPVHFGADLCQRYERVD